MSEVTLLVEQQKNIVRAPAKQGIAAVSTKNPIRVKVMAIGVPEGKIRSIGFPQDTKFFCSPEKGLAYLSEDPSIGVIVVFPHNIGGTSVCDEILTPTITVADPKHPKDKTKRRLKRQPFTGLVLVVTDSPKILRGYAGGGQILRIGELNTALARALNK